MRTNSKIIVKIFLLVSFLCVTPFFKGITVWMQDNGFLDACVYHQYELNESISIKDQMNLLSYHSDLTITDDFEFEMTQDQGQKDPNAAADAGQDGEKTDADATENAKDTGKKVYIYSTHQSEEYVGGQTVMDASAILGNALEKRGIHVVLETANFKEYLNAQGWDYNQSYRASYNYLNDALVNYGGFDLIIDLHRDAIPREASYLDANGKRYAKMMPVVGGLGKNAAAIKKSSAALSDIIDAKVHGIMRSTMIREAYYNQEVSDRMMLIECGGNVNPFAEVENSMAVLADGIYDYLTR